MNAIETVIAKINQACTDMEAGIATIDALTARVIACAKDMRERSAALSLAMGWTK